LTAKSGDCAATTPSSDRSAWVAACTQERAAARRRGTCPNLETLLATYPELDDETSIRLIYEEVCARREEGETIATEEVLRHFPRFFRELRVLFDCDRLLRTATRDPDYPEVGEELGPYSIVAELGRGGAGRIYLASELSLADRLVVLKVVPDDQDEHLCLARIQHTYIIPLFSERSFPERGVRALCMPYLGGTTLERLLAAVAPISPASRRGKDLVAALDREQAQYAAGAVIEGPCRRLLEGATWTQAICWITACLADALHAAHTHGLVHMDVKPPNVLVAGNGQPLLLDFHLARRPIRAGELIFDRLGGTEGWMAPEQRLAMAAARRGRPAMSPVDARCDVYALGLLLCDALDGSNAPAATLPDFCPWTPRNSAVGTGLTALVRRCLEPSASLRYESTAALADDLRRHLSDLPLRGVLDRNVAERWAKWRRRRPDALWRAAAWCLALTAVVVAAGAGGSFYFHRTLEAQKALDDGARLRSAQRFDEAAAVLARGLESLRGLPGSSRQERELRAQLRGAQSGQRAEQLHKLADRVRFRYGIDPPSPAERDLLVHHVHTIWRERRALLANDLLGAEAKRGVRTDLIELVLVWADLRSRLARPEEHPDASREVLTLLDEARAELGSSPALERQRHALATALGQSVVTDEKLTAPSGAWEHYELGRSYLREGRVHEAMREFERSLSERSQDFWPNFYQGLCAYRLGQYQEAVAAFRTCVALSPESAECAYNQALAWDALGRAEQAHDAYSRALRLDPGLVSAALNRGIIAYRTGRLASAAADFQQVARDSTDDATRGRAFYNWALAISARGDTANARAYAQKAVALGSAEAQALLKHLSRHSASEPARRERN
jgi:serine/threonine protein kinase/tetratricopeptide (TPR) repeat protein